MNKKIIIKVDESGYPTIEKITGDFSPYELLHRVVMAAMLKVYDETDQMPEEIFTDLSKIGMQFVDVANEELYGEEECEDEDDDKLGIPADIKHSNTKLIMAKVTFSLGAEGAVRIDKIKGNINTEDLIYTAVIGTMMHLYENTDLDEEEIADMIYGAANVFVESMQKVVKEDDEAVINEVLNKTNNNESI